MINLTLYPTGHDDIFTEDFTVTLNAEYDNSGNFPTEDLLTAAVVEFGIIKDGNIIVVRGDRIDCDPETGAGNFESDDFGTTLVFDVPPAAICGIITRQA